jgi:RHS repeat-associated protein
VDAIVDPGNSAKVNFTARAVGVATDYSLQLSPAGDFGFNSSSGAALTGGRDATTNPDTGSVAIVVNGVGYSTSFGGADSDGSGVASRLAALVSAGPYANASSVGNTVSLTGKAAGPVGGYSLSASYTWNTTSFAQPSFTTSADASLSNIGNSPYVTFYQYDALGNMLRVDQKGAAPSDGSQWRTRTFVYDSLSQLLTATNPESGTITYSYDADGNLLQKTSPAPNQTGTATQTVSYCYDALHRVTGRGYGAQSCPLATPVVTYAYDSGANAIGKLTALTDQAGTANYTYDVLGRLAAETRTLTGANNAAISKNLSYSYNLDGSLKTLTYPSGNVVTYAPDSAGRILSTVDSGSGINYVTGATYGPDSALTGFVSGNSGTFAGITNAFSYNKRLQPLAMSAASPSQTLYSIGYDFHVGNGTTGADNGNVWEITNYKNTTRNQSFTYDALNRLTSAQNAGTNCSTSTVNGKTEYWGNSYGYDAWGNLLQKSITKCGAENLSVTADAHNWIHATAPDYQYDAAGNMTYDATAGLGYTFDPENRITGANGYTYTYDGDGNRVRKSNGNLAANGTLYWYMTPGVVAESDLAGALKSEYVFFDGERVARRDGPTGAAGVFYYFSDHLKTASVITDSAGVIKAESDYYPWGGELQFVNNDSNDYKFTGKKRDTETGLDYFGARYYSSGLGRFISADWSETPVPVPYADLNDPQSLNMHTYVRNLPTTRFDADGHQDDKNMEMWTRIMAAITAPLNMWIGGEKLLVTAPALALAPETGGAAGVAAAYLGVNGTGQTLTGGAQLIYAATGNKGAEDSAKLFTSATTVSGLVTLTVTGDPNKAALAGSIENGIPAIPGVMNDKAPAMVEYFVSMVETLFGHANLDTHKPKPSTAPAPAPPPLPTPVSAADQKKKQETTQTGPGSNRQYSVGPNPGEKTGLICRGKACPR